jgi:tetratricopeptide (TPR) repeat protein
MVLNYFDKTILPKRLTTFALIVFSVVFLDTPRTFARDSWVSVRSNHLLVIGNGTDRDIRIVAARLEQFREVVTRIIARPEIESAVPTTVIVFKDDAAYRPFKTSENNAGYFQPGQDVNYITLSAETRGDQDHFNIIFHEYTHLIVNNSIGSSPAWFNEGLAELYSTLGISNTGIVVGRPIARHVTSLRENAFLPLRLLFQVDYQSPYYNETQKQSIFYAESWAFMHYVMLNRNGERAKQVITFLELLRAHEPLDQAVQKAFATSVENLEGEFRSYIQQDRFRSAETTLSSNAKPDLSMTSMFISDAELQAYLGDLLAHSNRSDAEIYLQKALQLDPKLTLAQSSLGILRFRQGRFGEALTYLETAANADTQNALLHYYYASALSRSNNDDVSLTIGYSPEVAARARSELKKAIALKKDFIDSYNLLAYINLVTSTEIDETIELLNANLTRFAGRIDVIYMLGQLYMHEDDYKHARPMLNQVVAETVEPRIREHAQKLLVTISSIEERQAQRETARMARGLNPEVLEAGNQVTDPSDGLREALRVPATGESRVQGTLLSIDCEPMGLVFVVKTNDRVLHLKTDTFQQIKRTTFTEDVKGTVTCGVRKPSNAVVVCYVPMGDQRAKFDGVLRSVEFVPADFRLAPTTP